jgi:hypothetical protein
MKEQYVNVLPKSAIGKALGYSIERWDRLSAYFNDGRLNIDNSPVENSIRPSRWVVKIIYSPALIACPALRESRQTQWYALLAARHLQYAWHRTLCLP